MPWAANTPAQVNSKFTASVAGVGDVLIGSPAWNRSRPWPGLDTGNPPEEGAVFLYHGGPSGITGSNVSFTVILTNTGSTAITQAQLSLTVPLDNLIKGMQPAGIITLADIPVGGSVIHSWTGTADKEGSGSIAIEGLSNGVSIDTVLTSITVAK